eukprot:scaffold14107_cov75-Skeletonema_marinoi.AAC.1
MSDLAIPCRVPARHLSVREFYEPEGGPHSALVRCRTKCCRQQPLIYSYFSLPFFSPPNYFFCHFSAKKKKSVDYLFRRQVCSCGSSRCHCNSNNLRAYWEAAQLLSLVMPSSGAAERVFSLLNNHFNEHQTRSLSDQIFLSLYLSYNKR